MDATKITLSLQPIHSDYTKLQYKYFKTILNSRFTFEQNRDTQFILPPTSVSFTQIFINKCNPEKDIHSNKDTIQINNEHIHVYEDTGKHLITIPTTILKWL